MATTRPEGALVNLRVQPRAARNEIVAWQDEALRVRVTAPPVEGEANTAVRQLVARTLGVAPSTVTLVRGERSRDKVVRVAGLSLATVRARLAAVVSAALLLCAAPAFADHLALDPGARPLAPRPFDADVNLRFEDGGFHVGGRIGAFGQSFGAWLRGRAREGGVTLDGQLHGDRTYNFRLDGDGKRPSIKIEVWPGTI
jgi:uncharacterized protein (TIGR00251 family)